MEYAVRFIHKISPRDTDIGPQVTITDADLANAKTLAKSLRRQNALLGGARVREWRKEKDGRIVVFPTLPGMTTYWHSVILTPVQS